MAFKNEQLIYLTIVTDNKDLFVYLSISSSILNDVKQKNLKSIKILLFNKLESKLVNFLVLL